MHPVSFRACVAAIGFLSLCSQAQEKTLPRCSSSVGSKFSFFAIRMQPAGSANGYPNSDTRVIRRITPRKSLEQASTNSLGLCSTCATIRCHTLKPLRSFLLEYALCRFETQETSEKVSIDEPLVVLADLNNMQTRIFARALQAPKHYRNEAFALSSSRSSLSSLRWPTTARNLSAHYLQRLWRALALLYSRQIRRIFESKG